MALYINAFLLMGVCNGPTLLVHGEGHKAMGNNYEYMHMIRYGW